MIVRRSWPSRFVIAALLGIFVGSAGAQKKNPDDKRDLPLEPADTLEFTVDEGTWISLDVTPDGESIIFELLGDLYRLPMAGGSATRLTSGMAYDSQPRVSPDGKWVAFVSDGDGADNVWIRSLEPPVDGAEPTQRKLSSESQSGVISPAWTADSQYVIATVAGARGGLRMFHIDVESKSGLTLGEVPRPDQGSAGGGGPFRVGAAQSPDGRYLYFSERSGATRGPLGRWQVGRMDMRSGDVDRITQAEGSGLRPALSPDGRLLAYATRYESQTGLRLRDLESGGDRWLVYPIQRDSQEIGSPARDTVPGYAFTADGSEVVYTAGGGIHRIAVETGVVTEVPFTADIELEVGPDLTRPYRVEQGPVRAKLIHDPRLHGSALPTISWPARASPRSTSRIPARSPAKTAALCGG